MGSGRWLAPVLAAALCAGGCGIVADLEPTPTATPTATPTPTPTPTATPTPTPTPRPTATPTPTPYRSPSFPTPWQPPTPWRPPGYFPTPRSDVVESCTGSFDLRASPGFKVRVECVRWRWNTLFTITVKTDYFADFDYPIIIKVEVDPPNAISDSETEHLHYDGDSVEFDWPADFLYFDDPVVGTYRITVKASDFGDNLTIASGSFTIR